MADWATISSLATAGGTLVLAAAKYSAVRSANRSARIAEQTRQVGLRPVLVSSRLQDPPEKISWVDDHWTKVPGGGATAEIVDGNLLFAMSLRNVGAGIAVLQGWLPNAEQDPARRTAERPHGDPETFRRQTRDLYVPPWDVGFWQGAIRDMTDGAYPDMLRAIEARQRLIVDLLYTDHEGGQRAISRFAMVPRQDSGYMCTIVRHWNLDRQDPR
jgi:hypothetical protein